MPHAPDVLVRLAAPAQATCPGCGQRRAQRAAEHLRSRGALLLALCGLMACAGSRARPPPSASSEPVRRLPSAPLEPSDIARAASWNYSAPDSCPSQAQLFEQIARRVPASSARDVGGAGSSSVDIDVQSGDSEWVGRVSIQSATDAVSREVTGAGCDEVVEALALIASLWLRPREAEAARGSISVAAETPATEATPVAARRSDWAASAARAEGGASDEPARPELDAERSPDPRVADVERLAQTDGAPKDGASASTGGADRASTHRVQIAGLLGYASQPAGAFSARLQLERWGSSSVSSWSMAIGAAFAAGRHESERLGAAALRLYAGQVELCPPGLDVSSSAWIRACAHGRAGALHFSATTERLPDARSLWRPWAALGASVHAGVPVSSSLSLRLVADVSLVLVRDEFATERPLAAGDPARDVFTFYEISPVSFDVGLGAAHVF